MEERDEVLCGVSGEVLTLDGEGDTLDCELTSEESLSFDKLDLCLEVCFESMVCLADSAETCFACCMKSNREVVVPSACFLRGESIDAERGRGRRRRREVSFLGDYKRTILDNLKSDLGGVVLTYTTCARGFD